MPAAFEFFRPEPSDASKESLIFESFDQTSGTFIEETLTYSNLEEELKKDLQHEEVNEESLMAIEAKPERNNVIQLLRRLYRGLPTLLLHPALNSDQQRQLIKEAHQYELHPEALLILATSGSSGTPKLVQLNAAQLIAAAEASAKMHPFVPNDRWLLALPYAHIGGCSILLRCLRAGACAVFPSSKEPSSIHRLDITIASLVPTQLRQWLETEVNFKSSRLRYQLVGGAPSPEDLLLKARARGLNPLRTYGMTETCAQVATEESFLAGLYPLSGVEISIQNGEICIKSPQLMLGYLGQHPLKAEEFFHTGDRGSLSSELRVFGRFDARFISGGENISPEWAESQVGAVKGVKEWALTWLKDTHWGQAAAVLYVPDVNESSSGLELEESFAILPAFARPKRFFKVKALPKTETGKWARTLFHPLAEELADNENLIGPSSDGES